MAPFEALAEDLTWFVTCPDVRVLHVATSGEERPVVLEQVAMTEAHACNRSPFFVLEDAHTEAAPGWQVRADRMRVVHEARREAMAREGYRLEPLPPRPVVIDDVAMFMAQVAQCLAAQRDVKELEGIVVVLAPTMLDASAAFVEALVGCLRDPSCTDARFIVIELGVTAAAPLAETLGDAVLCTTCERDAADAAGDQKAILASGMTALPGASPEMRAGFAGPKDIVAPTRYGQPPRDALASPALDAAIHKAVGPEAALAGPLGAAVKAQVFGAALAMQEARYDDAVRIQAEARDVCIQSGMVKLGSLLEITLATYLLRAGRSADARVSFGASASRASAANMFDVAAQARLGLGAVLTVDRELVAATVEYVLAGEAAERAESTALAIECYRLAGQHALSAGAEDVAVASWRSALAVARALAPEEARASSAVVTARALAKVLGDQGSSAAAASLLDEADAIERTESPKGPSATPTPFDGGV